MDDMHSRLTAARINAGFSSRREACARFGWSYSTYSAHENTQNKYDDSQAKIYGKAFNVSPEWLLFKTETAIPASAPGGIDEQLRKLPEEQSRMLMERFSAMIEGVKVAGKIR